MRRFRASIDYAQLFLAPPGASPVFDAAQEVTLVCIAEGPSLIISTGIMGGPIRVAINDGAGTSADAASGPWEEQQTVEIDITEPLHVSSPTVMDPGVRGSVFEPAVPGPHLVTVQARGRHVRPGEFVDLDCEPVEEYQITLTRITR